MYLTSAHICVHRNINAFTLLFSWRLIKQNKECWNLKYLSLWRKVTYMIVLILVDISTRSKTKIWTLILIWRIHRPGNNSSDAVFLNIDKQHMFLFFRVYLLEVTGKNLLDMFYWSVSKKYFLPLSNETELRNVFMKFKFSDISNRFRNFAKSSKRIIVA